MGRVGEFALEADTAVAFTEEETYQYPNSITNTAAGIVAVIPAYNEERYIGSVVLTARQYADHVIVVNDGSSDNTSKIAASAGAIVVEHTINSGKAVALNTAFRKALEFNPKVVVALDGDWQHMPEQLPQVAAPILDDDADIVVGSRYLSNDSDVPTQRVIGHWGFTSVINLLSGVKVTDSQSGFRAFSRRVIEQISFASKGFTVESEMQFLANDYRLKVVEVPITIRYLDKPKRSVIKHGFHVLNGIINLVAQHRPLLFLGGSGLVSVMVGLLLGVLAFNQYMNDQTIPAALAIASLLLSINGTVAMFSGIILHSLRSYIIDYVKR